MDAEREALRAKLVDVGLSRIADYVVDQAKPTILLQTTEYKDGPIGASRIGGAPDAPPNFEWPMWKDKPMSFLAQINLAELAEVGTPLEMPREGLLLFFYDSGQSTWGFDPQDKGSWLVRLVDLEDLIRQPLPKELIGGQVFSSRLVRFTRSLSIPYYEAVEEHSSKLSLDELDLYGEIAWQGAREGVGFDKMLGHATPLQGSMELECQLVSNGLYCGDLTGWEDPRAKVLAAGAADWELLLQLDSETSDDGMMWGDSGMLYFWIKRDDLASAHFENTWMILQCN